LPPTNTLAYNKHLQITAEYSFQTYSPASSIMQSCIGRHDTKNNDIQHNDTQHNNKKCDTQHDDTQQNDFQLNYTQHNNLKCDTQHNNTQHNDQ